MMNFFGNMPGLQTGMGGNAFDAGPSQNFNHSGMGGMQLQQPMLNRQSLMMPRFGMQQPNHQIDNGTMHPPTNLDNRTRIQMPDQQQPGLWHAYNSYRNA